jgi:hypothetical protein
MLMGMRFLVMAGMIVVMGPVIATMLMVVGVGRPAVLVRMLVLM